MGADTLRDRLDSSATGGGEEDGVWMDEEPSCGRYKRSSHRIDEQVEWERAPGRYQEEDDRSIERGGCGHDARLTCELPGPYRFPCPNPPLPPQKILWWGQGRSPRAGPYFLRRLLPPVGEPRPASCMEHEESCQTGAVLASATRRTDVCY